MLHVFNTTKVGDREYTMSDLKSLHQLRDFGLDDGFYGGRVTQIGRTDTDVLLLIQNRDGMQLIDTAAEKLDDIPLGLLRRLAERRKVRFGVRTSKEDLVAALTA